MEVQRACSYYIGQGEGGPCVATAREMVGVAPRPSRRPLEALNPEARCRLRQHQVGGQRAAL